MPDAPHDAWLDLLVFDDPALRGLAEVVASRALAIAIDARARAELERVLAYPALALDASARARLLDIADGLATRRDVAPRVLPRCADPDDQMFLEIAVDAGARWLLTRDAALLRMARRMQREHGLAIIRPAAWREAYDAQMSKR